MNKIADNRTENKTKNIECIPKFEIYIIKEQNFKFCMCSNKYIPVLYIGNINGN